jgi:large subunit ribosomal protein L25
MVPGVVYGRNASGAEETIPVFVNAKDVTDNIRSLGRSLENTLFTLNVDGESITVLPRQLQAHPVDDTLLNLNFMRYVPGRRPGAKVGIPTRTINDERCIAFKDGGWLQPLVWKIPVYAWGEAIPTTLPMDVRGKRIGDRIMMSEIPLADGLTLRSRFEDFPVAKLVGSRRMMSQS